jgi:NAD(P)H-binding
MKVLVAGATGALGTQLVPKLVARGHEVVGTTRSESKREAVFDLGATPAVVDALDAEQVARVVAEAEPEVIVHELTALSGDFDLRHFDRTFAETNRLRTEATDHLLAAGRAVGVKRFVAQSYAGWPAARTGGPVKLRRAGHQPYLGGAACVAAPGHRGKRGFTSRTRSRSLLCRAPPEACCSEHSRANGGVLQVEHRIDGPILLIASMRWNSPPYRSANRASPCSFTSESSRW